jgi:hypothetical protein
MGDSCDGIPGVRSIGSTRKPAPLFIIPVGNISHFLIYREGNSWKVNKSIWITSKFVRKLTQCKT